MNTQHSNSLQKLVENASQLTQGLETLKLQNGNLLDGLSGQEEETNRGKRTGCGRAVVCTAQKWSWGMIYIDVMGIFLQSSKKCIR